MKNFKKILCLLLAVSVCCLLLLTGCHGSKGLKAFVMPEQLDMSREYEVTFWAKNDTNKAQTKIYEQAIADFEALYPNIHVNLRLYTNYGKIYNDVITNIATNTTPNVCITYPDHIATYLTGTNCMVPLDELFADEKYGLGGRELLFDSPTQDQIIPQFLHECIIGGHFYAIPYMRSTEACYVNKTLVEALGYTLPDQLTWDFVWEVSNAAAEKNADGTYVLNGQKVMIPFIYKSTDNMMIQMLYQCGADYATPDGEIRIFHDTTRGILKNIAQQVKNHAFSTFKISSYPANFLNAGQCLFAIDSTAGATWMGTHAPLSDISEDKFVEFETEVMAIPQVDPRNPKMISQGPSVCVFNKKDPQEVLASWLFAQYLLTDEVQIAYAQTEGYVPVTSKAQASPRYQSYLNQCGADNQLHYDVKIKASRLLLENTQHTFVTPVFNGSASLRDAAGQMIENTAKSVNRKEQIDEAYFDTLFESMISLYHLDPSGEMAESSRPGKTDLGKLPETSVVLLASLAIIWALIVLYAIMEFMKKKKR